MPQHTQSQAILSRYDDAYLVAKATVGFGGFIKVLGVALGGIIIFLSILIIASKNSGFFQLGVIGVFSGCFVGLWTYLFGILVSAQGQTLKASLDTAVNSSPFISNQQRAMILSLPPISETEESRGFTFDVNGNEVTASFLTALDFDFNIVVEASSRVIESAFGDRTEGSQSYVEWSHQGRSVKAIKLGGINQDYVSVVQVGAGSGKVQSVVISKVPKGSLG